MQASQGSGMAMSEKVKRPSECGPELHDPELLVISSRVQVAPLTPAATVGTAGWSRASSQMETRTVKGVALGWSVGKEVTFTLSCLPPTLNMLLLTFGMLTVVGYVISNCRM